jgi:hypothetical protein
MTAGALRTAVVYLAYVVSLTYVLGVAFLTARVGRYAVDPRRLPRPDDILRPHLFRAEGQLHRRRAVRFLCVGAGIVCICWGLTFL